MPQLNRLMTAAGKDATSLAAELCLVIGAAVRGGMADAAEREPAANDLLAYQCLRAVCEEAVEAEAMADKAIAVSNPATTEGARTTMKDSGASANAAELLRRGIIAAEFRPPAAISRGCVRLLDPHRALNQRFDVVFICGLLEKQFPGLGREDIFLADADRRWLNERHGLNFKTSELRLAEERFLFHRAFSRARRQVYLCYPDCDQQGKPTIPSLFVDDVLSLLEPEPSHQQAALAGFENITVQRPISAVIFDIQEAPTRNQALRSLAFYAGSHSLKSDQREQLDKIATAAGLQERLQGIIETSTRGCRPLADARILARIQALDEFRVTELQRYFGCPFRYFVERQLRPQAMQPVAPSLKRGQIVHEILRNFGERVLMKAQVVMAQADDATMREALRQMQDLVEEAFADTGEDLETLIMRTELDYQLNRFLKRERASGRYLKTYDLELAFGDACRHNAGKQSTKSMLIINDIKLKGRIDRVDWEDHNRAVVIDYKTSKTIKSWDKFQQNKDIQIPLYILALRDIFGFEPVGGEYYALLGEQRRGLYLDGTQDLLGAGAGQMNDQDFVDAAVFDAQLQAARDLAYQAASSIRRGEFPCAPLNRQTDCGYCDFSGICRISDSGNITRGSGNE